MSRKYTLAIVLMSVAAVHMSSNTATAAWVTTVGKVQAIQTYHQNATILVRLENQPAGPVPPGCTSTDFFAIGSSLSSESRQFFLTQLLSAQARGANINITWDDTSAGCVAYDSTTVVPGIQRLVSVP